MTQVTKRHQFQRDKGYSDQADEGTSARGRNTQSCWESPRRNAVGGGTKVNVVRGGWPHDHGLCKDRLRSADAWVRQPGRGRLWGGRKRGDRRPLQLQKVGIVLSITCWTLGS